jgi:broad specificity polyphosphatase/5'/3'-nucleotidase SurE
MKGGKMMTVGTQLQQVIVGIESAASSMKMFALETQDQQAKQTFEQLAQTLTGAVASLKQRQQYVQSEEPQYKQ